MQHQHLPISFGLVDEKVKWEDLEFTKVAKVFEREEKDDECTLWWEFDKKFPFVPLAESEKKDVKPIHWNMDSLLYIQLLHYVAILWSGQTLPTKENKIVFVTTRSKVLDLFMVNLTRVSGLKTFLLQWDQDMQSEMGYFPSLSRAQWVIQSLENSNLYIGLNESGPQQLPIERWSNELVNGFRKDCKKLKSQKSITGTQALIFDCYLKMGKKPQLLAIGMLNKES